MMTWKGSARKRSSVIKTSVQYLTAENEENHDKHDSRLSASRSTEHHTIPAYSITARSHCGPLRRDAVQSGWLVPTFRWHTLSRPSGYAHGLYSAVLLYRVVV
jgi:hypothetical protein